MKRPHVVVVVALQTLAFWPVWRWYAARIAGSTDETWSLLALATLAFFICRRREAPRETNATLDAERTRAACASLLWPTLLVVLYMVAYPFAPPLLRAALAFVTIGLTLSLLWRRRGLGAGEFGLLFLSLPLIPSLQFYGGYPLRLFVAGVTAPLLQLGGFGVIQEGTCLNWGGQLIWIDAPCSGVRMLWAGLYLACALVCFYNMRGFRAFSALAVAFVAIIAGNVFRALGLFYTEAGIVEMPSWAHAGMGMVSFVLVAVGVLAAVQWLRRREKLCEAALSI
jgi:exosortase/archaeosortase family protein